MLDLSLNMYKCFGCGKGGDIISFVQELKGFDFVEAVKFLLKTYCPDVDTSDLYAKQTVEGKKPNGIGRACLFVTSMLTISSGNNTRQIVRSQPAVVFMLKTVGNGSSVRRWGWAMRHQEETISWHLPRNRV